MSYDDQVQLLDPSTSSASPAEGDVQMKEEGAPGQAKPGKEKPKAKPAASKAPTKAAKKATRADLLDAIQQWEKAHKDAMFASALYSINNVARFRARTGGEGPKSDKESALGVFAKGLKGNVVTDAPDALIKLIVGNGIADGVGDIAGEVVGAAAGVAGGLVTSAILATVAEMAINYLTDADAAEKAALHQAIGDVGGAVALATRDDAVKEIKGLQGKLDALDKETFGFVRSTDSLEKEVDIKNACKTLTQSAALVTSKAPREDDTSFADELLRDWAKQNVGKIDGWGQIESNGRVNVAKWAEVLKDKSIMKLSQDELAKSFVGESKDGLRTYDLADAQVRGALSAAGIEAPKGKVADGTTLTHKVSSPALFRQFVFDNWEHSITEEEASSWKISNIYTIKAVKPGPFVVNIVLKSIECRPIPPKGNWLPGKVMNNMCE